eukprot:gene26873-31519_t
MARGNDSFTRAEEESLRAQAFHLFDADGSGAIDLDEMKLAMKGLGFDTHPHTRVWVVGFENIPDREVETMPRRGAAPEKGEHRRPQRRVVVGGAWMKGPNYGMPLPPDRPPVTAVDGEWIEKAGKQFTNTLNQVILFIELKKYPELRLKSEVIEFLWQLPAEQRKIFPPELQGWFTEDHVTATEVWKEQPPHMHVELPLLDAPWARRDTGQLQMLKDVLRRNATQLSESLRQELLKPGAPPIMSGPDTEDADTTDLVSFKAPESLRLLLGSPRDLVVLSEWTDAAPSPTDVVQLRVGCLRRTEVLYTDFMANFIEPCVTVEDQDGNPFMSDTGLGVLLEKGQRGV